MSRNFDMDQFRMDRQEVQRTKEVDGKTVHYAKRKEWTPPKGNVFVDDVSLHKEDLKVPKSQVVTERRDEPKTIKTTCGICGKDIELLSTQILRFEDSEYRCDKCIHKGSRIILDN